MSVSMPEGTPRFRTADQLVLDGTFPTSAEKLRQIARQYNVGRKLGLTYLFSDADVIRLYEVMPCPSKSSSVLSPQTGSFAAPSGEFALKKARGTPDKRAAEEIRAKREAEILTESIYGRTATTTFAQAALSFLEEDGSRRFVMRVLDHFGTTPLRLIGQETIDTAASKLYPKASTATRNRQVYTPVSAILHHAARKGWCPRPTLARPKTARVEVRWLKPEEAERLIAASGEHLRPLVVSWLYTGARAGEALWLDLGTTLISTAATLLFRRPRMGNLEA